MKNLSNKKFSIALATMLATSTVVATTPLAALANCNSPLNSVLNSPCDLDETQDFQISGSDPLEGGFDINNNDDFYAIGADNYSGLLTNDGSINISFSGGQDIYGITINSLNEDGVVTNNGTINVDLQNASDYTAHGIFVSDQYNSSILNNGTINVSAADDNSYAYGYGIISEVLIEDGGTSLISNSGTINVSAVVGNNDGAEAAGIYNTLGGEGGTISNSGAINIYAEAAGGLVYGYGMAFNGTGGEGGLIENSGSVNVVSNSGFTADGFGIVGFGTPSEKTIINTGLISVSATGEDYADGYGIAFNTPSSGDLGLFAVQNEGSMIVSSDAINETAKAYGVSYDANGAEGGLIGLVFNEGLISATATSQEDNANSYGIYLKPGGAYFGIIQNDGSIISSATSTDVQADAVGIVSLSLFANSGILNNGLISVTADGGNAATASGIIIGDMDDDSGITNNGNIIVHASVDNSNDGAFGIMVNDFIGTIENNGNIIATAASDGSRGYSILTASGGEGGFIDNTGTLYGNLFVDSNSTVENSGLIALPGGSEALIDGAYNQNLSGVLGFGVKAADNFATLAVEGAANFTNGTKLRVTLEGGNTYTGTDLLNVVTATSLTSGSSFDVLDNSLAWNFVGSKDGNTIDIEAIATDLTTLSDALAGTSGAGAAGEIDKFLGGSETPLPALYPFLDLISSASTEQEIKDLVDQTLPLLSGGVEQAISDAMGNTNKVIEARQEGTSGMSSGDEADADKAVWLRTFGSWAEQGDRDGTAGFDSQSTGLVLGGDKLISDDVRLGVAAVYSNTNVDSNSSVAPQENEINTYQAVVYGTYSFSEVTDLNFQADLGLNQNEGTRTILAVPAVAQSDFDSWSQHIGTAVRHLITLNETTSFIPSASIDFTNITTDSYTETGAGVLNLSVAEDDQQELVIGLNGKVEHKLTDNFAVNANLGAGYDLMADRNSVTANYVGGGGAFTTNGIDQDPVVLSGGVGTILNNFHGVEVSAKYDVEARTSDYTNQTASIKLRMPF